jgi:arsenate reductase (glutaredoxin)
MNFEKMITIYHNPRCSKSREALALVEGFTAAHGLTLSVVDYQKTPLTVTQLCALRDQLGTSVREMVRDNEAEYAALNLAAADDTALLAAIADHPKLLQRPIVAFQGKAMVGRPPERLAALLQMK